MLKLSLVLIALGGHAAGAASVRHLTLVKSSPAAAATLTESPREVVLTFNERLDPARRAISMRGPSGAVPMEAVRAVADTLAFAATIPGTLMPGSYTVSWLAGAPGHGTVRGRFTFTVAGARD